MKLIILILTLKIRKEKIEKNVTTNSLFTVCDLVLNILTRLGPPDDPMYLNNQTTLHYFCFLCCIEEPILNSRSNIGYFPTPADLVIITEFSD